MLSHFADVQQPISPGDDLNESAEIRQPRNSTEISLPYLGRSRKIANDLQRLIRRSLVVGSHVNFARVFDVDLYPSLLNDGANHFAAGANHIANLVDRNLQGINPRSISRNLLAMLSNPLAHLLQNVQPPALRLRQSLPHNLSGNAADLNIHLQRSDSVFCPRDFEIHVAVMIFSSGNVSQDGV